MIDGDDLTAAEVENLDDDVFDALVERIVAEEVTPVAETNRPIADPESVSIESAWAWITQFRPDVGELAVASVRSGQYRDLFATIQERT